MTISVEDTTFSPKHLDPALVISYGFNQYLADHSKDSILRESARAVCEHVRKLFKHLLATTTEREQLFVTQIWAAANDLAKGIAGRKNDREAHLAAAKLKWEQEVKRNAQTEKFSGILKGGFQLLLLGGVSYLIAWLIFGSAKISDGRLAEHRENASLALALGSALIGSFWKAWSIGRAMRRIFHEYDEECEKAQSIYCQGAIAAYRLAAETAAFEYSKLFNCKPVVSQAIDNLLMHLLGSDNIVRPDSSPP